MNKIDEIAKSLGFMVKRTCEFNAYYYLVDEKGFDKYNSNGERLCVEIGLCVNPGGKNSLPYLWHENGFTKEVMQNWWNVQTYVTNRKGESFHAYNPTTKKRFDGKGIEINFDWHLSGTPENFKKLLEEILRRFNSSEN